MTGPRRSEAVAPEAAVIAWTSRTSAVAAAPDGGQLRSGVVQPCHVTRVVDPNDALFIHGSIVIPWLFAVAKSAKNFLTAAASGLNAFGAETPPPPRADETTVAVASEFTEIVYPEKFVDPELTIVAPSGGGLAAELVASIPKAKAAAAIAVMQVRLISRSVRSVCPSRSGRRIRGGRYKYMRRRRDTRTSRHSRFRWCRE
jgi:hypothetical protein